MCDSVLVGYLADSHRFFNFGFFCDTICRVKNRNAFKIVVLVHEHFMVERVNTSLNEKKMEGIDVVYVPDPNNYINKIKRIISLAKENDCKFSIKLDNDILFHPSILDYMYEKRHLIDDPYTSKNLCISPNLTTGIPTCDYFMKDFFTASEREEMNAEFANHNFGEVWGFDYSFLNKLKGSWDTEKYYTEINNSPIYYKGIHPVRVNNSIMAKFNEIVLRHVDEFAKEHDYYTYSPPFEVYLCNSFFMIKTNVYETLVYDQSLYVDPFDEVPLNKFCTKEGMKKVYIGNSFTFHPWYNSYPNHVNAERETYEYIMRTCF